MFTGQLDIKNAFYMFELPRQLRELFSLPPVTAQSLGRRALQGRALPPSTLVWPQIKVAPMGWTHAL
eukprot:8947725-Alexandrium_andersonii.AAC.1